MNTQHQTIGIDVGKDAIFVGFLPAHARTPVQDFPTVKIDLLDPFWWTTFIDLVGQGATITAEPTGTHLLTPIAAMLELHRPDADLWLVEGKTTQHFRSLHVSSAKNDRLDAITLTLIAREIRSGKPPRGCRPFDYTAASVVQQLRIRVNTHQRMTRENTRALNRLDKLAHGIFPILAQKLEAYTRCIRAGYADPQALKHLINSPDEARAIYPDGRARRHIVSLAEYLPEGLRADPEILEAIHEQVRNLDNLQPAIAANLAVIQRLILHPQLATITRRWMTITGWSSIYLAALHVATHGRALDMTKPEFQAACGVAPLTSISGDGDRTRNTRKGYRPVKWSVHLWAAFMCSPKAAPNPIRTYYQRREATVPHKVTTRGGKRKIVNQNFGAAKNKLARVLWGTARNARLDDLPILTESDAQED